METPVAVTSHFIASPHSLSENGYEYDYVAIDRINVNRRDEYARSYSTQNVIPGFNQI